MMFISCFENFSKHFLISRTPGFNQSSTEITSVYFGLRVDETCDFVFLRSFLLNCVFGRARLQILTKLFAAVRRKADISTSLEECQTIFCNRQVIIAGAWLSCVCLGPLFRTKSPHPQWAGSVPCGASGRTQSFDKSLQQITFLPAEFVNSVLPSAFCVSLIAVRLITVSVWSSRAWHPN